MTSHQITQNVFCFFNSFHADGNKMKLSLRGNLKVLTRLMWLEDVIMNPKHRTLKHNLAKLVRKKPFTFQHSEWHVSNIQRYFSKWRSPEQPHFQCSSTALAQRYFSPRKITKPQPHITWNPAVDLSLGETKTHNMCLEARRGLRIFFLRWKWNNAGEIVVTP